MTPEVQFKKFVKLFLQGSLESAGNNAEFIGSAVRLMEPNAKPAVHAYIREILGNGMGEPELHKIWLSCSPNYWIEEGKMREFLSEILTQLE